MAGERETIRHMWQDYRASCIPANAPPMQIVETRRAFYGGVWALFCRLNSNAAANVSEAAAVAYLRQIDAEMDRFKKSVGTPLEGRE